MAETQSPPPAAANESLTILQRLNAAISSKAGLQNDLSAANLRIDALGAEITRLQTDLDKSGVAALQLQSQLEAANTQIAAVTSERDAARNEVSTLRAAATTTAAEVAEVVASVGFPVSNLPKVDDKPAASEPRTPAEFNAAIAAEKDPIKRARLRKAMLN